MKKLLVVLGLFLLVSCTTQDATTVQAIAANSCGKVYHLADVYNYNRVYIRQDTLNTFNSCNAISTKKDTIYFLNEIKLVFQKR